MEAVDRVPILRLSREGRKSLEAKVAREFPLTLMLNRQELVTLLCSPANLEYLAVGFLFSEGLLKSKEEIKSLAVDEKRGVVWLETREDKGLADIFSGRLIASGGGRSGAHYPLTDTSSQKINSQMEISADEVLALVHEFQHSSQVYLATHGVHSAALCDRERILVFADDIGRHNAMDKVFGRCLLQGIATKDRVVMTSGRVTSEIMYKVAKRGIPIIISIAVPTDLGVRIAHDLGITLVGAVREERMNIYTHEGRLIAGGK